MASFASDTAFGSLTGSQVRGRSGFLPGWLVCLAFLLGFLTLWTGRSQLVPLFFVLGYTAILCMLVRTTCLWADPFNPLCLMIVIGVVRFSIPGLLLWLGVEPPREIGIFFQLMKLTEREWLWGHVLAVEGMLGAILGWLLVQGQRSQMPRRGLRLYLSDETLYAAAGGMLVGVGALLVFVATNASMDVVRSGEFRDTTIQTGTGKYFFLAYLLIAGTVLLACFLLRKGRPWLSYLPAGICLMMYGVLGGRARATIAVAGVLLLHWYFRRESRGWHKLSVKPAHLFIAPLVGLLAVWLSYVGSLYRGDLGARGIVEGLTLTGLWEYVEGSIFTDIGQLHGLAGAIAIGPAVLNGQTFFGSLAWPLTRFLPIPARSAGVFIVETLAGFSSYEERWGVNASLIGDAYLNFSLWGTASVMVLYGALTKLLYVRFRQGLLHLAIYVLGALYGLQIFWVSIEVWPQALTVIGFAYLLIFLSGTVFRLNK